MSSTSPGVPGFETINVVAEGPTSIVRARSLDDGAEVIIKLLDPASEPLLPKRFDRRRRALLRLSNSDQGFAALLDHGVATDGRSYVVVPSVPLGSLQDQLDRGPTPWFPASKLMATVAEAVGRAHQEEAALGDIRPSKILLKAADAPVVAAFGMASRRFDDGRPSYRAPEIDNDTPPTAPADVYSLALVLATLIAGRAKERNEPTEAFLTELVGLAPARIHEVLEHGLAESVTNRYGSGTAMHRALARAIDELPDNDVGGERDSSPVDLDDLLDDAVPVLAPAVTTIEIRPTADGLPAGLDDIVLVGDSTTDHDDDGGDSDEGTEEDHLLLPAGLDDIVLVDPAFAGDDTTPFPLDPITTVNGVTAIGVESTNGAGPSDESDGSERDAGEPVHPINAQVDAEHDTATIQAAPVDEGLTIIDLTTATSLPAPTVDDDGGWPTVGAVAVPGQVVGVVDDREFDPVAGHGLDEASLVVLVGEPRGVDGEADHLPVVPVDQVRQLLDGAKRRLAAEGPERDDHHTTFHIGGGQGSRGQPAAALDRGSDGNHAGPIGPDRAELTNPVASAVVPEGQWGFGGGSRRATTTFGLAKLPRSERNGESSPDDQRLPGSGRLGLPGPGGHRRRTRPAGGAAADHDLSGARRRPPPDGCCHGRARPRHGGQGRHGLPQLGPPAQLLLRGQRQRPGLRPHQLPAERR